MAERVAAIYTRISDDREGSNLGVDRQEQDCREVAARMGWSVVRIYTDNDVSAFRSRKKRVQYLAMLESIDRGEVTAVLTWHNDRLHRSARELEDFIDLVERTGTAVQTVQAGSYDLTSSTGRMTARIVGAVAQHESEHKRDRQLRKARELAEAGKVGSGGHRPFGFEPDRKTVREAEAVVLRSLYTQVLAGRSLSSLRRQLAEAGVLTSTGRPWTLQALRYNLLSGRNAGLRQHRGQVVAAAEWPAIVDRETWEATSALLLDPARYTGRAQDGSRKYLLTRFLRCGLCGSALAPNRQAELQRFACRKDRGGCGSILIRYSPAEEHIVDLVLDRLEAEMDLTPDGDPPPQTDVSAQIAHEEGRLAALVAAYSDNPDGDPLELRLASAKHREKIEALKRKRATEITAARTADPRAVRQEWLSGNFDLAQKRAVVDTLIERVDVAPGVRGRNYFDPERLSITWR